MVGWEGKLFEFGTLKEEGLPGCHSGIIVAVTAWNKRGETDRVERQSRPGE